MGSGHYLPTTIKNTVFVSKSSKLADAQLKKKACLKKKTNCANPIFTTYTEPFLLPPYSVRSRSVCYTYLNIIRDLFIKIRHMFNRYIDPAVYPP